MRIVYWLRRDLRLTDNPALQWACQEASALCLVYIHDPAEPIGAASAWWLHESLAALQKQLSERGQTLLLRHGDCAAELDAVTQDFQADAVCWNRLYEPRSLQRDRQIKQQLRKTGLLARSFNAALLLEPWQLKNKQDQPYRVFTPFWKAARELLPTDVSIATPPRLPGAPKLPAGVALDQFKLHPRHAWADKLAAHWQVGEAAALDQLEHFMAQALGDYSHARDLPDRPGTSRLSPHLHFGEIGPRQVRAALAGTDSPAADKYLAELGWREFAHYLLFHFPHSVDQPFNPRFAKFDWQRAADHPATFQRWCEGNTGIELVDAGMRELWQSGWMHNRVRMIVGSFLTKNLGLSWRDGAAWFFDTLVDADLANNTLGWQWVAGCGADAAPYFRIFNPDTQAEKFDAQKGYRDKWLPSQRPAAMVDLKASRQQALDRYQKIRQSQD